MSLEQPFGLALGEKAQQQISGAAGRDGAAARSRRARNDGIITTVFNAAKLPLTHRPSPRRLPAGTGLPPRLFWGHGMRVALSSPAERDGRGPMPLSGETGLPNPPLGLSRINPMDLHADLNRRVVLDTQALPWSPSPMAGVERRLLDRRGDEVARATSIVRYAPGSRFARHVHHGGEEILVLEGTFCDEHGDYGAGTYLRNPPGSSHAPFSVQGCTILVKLQQMHPLDQQRLVNDTISSGWVPGLVPGLQVLPLHAFGSEYVALVRWAPGTVFQPHGHPGGEEILVLEGVFQDEHGSYPAGSWLRNPPGSAHRPWSKVGCTIWVKTGHLPSTLGADGSEA